MNRFVMFVVMFALSSVCFAGKDYFASPSEPHAVVTGMLDQPSREMFAVKITEVNGDFTSREQGVWLKPGTYTINAKGAKFDRRWTGSVGRDSNHPVKRGGYEIELDLEAGKTYHIALDTSSANRADWKLVNWRVEETR